MNFFMDFLSIIYQFLANRKILEDETFRDQFIQSLSEVCDYTFNQINIHMESIAYFRHLDNDSENDLGDPDLLEEDTSYFPYSAFNESVDLKTLKKFYFKLYTYLSFHADENVIGDFQNIYGPYISNSIENINDFINDFDEIMDSVDLCQTEGCAPSIRQYYNIFYSIIRYNVYRLAIQNITGIERPINTSNIFLPIFNAHMLATLSDFYEKLVNEFPEKKSDESYLHKISDICKLFNVFISSSRFIQQEIIYCILSGNHENNPNILPFLTDPGFFSELNNILSIYSTFLANNLRDALVLNEIRVVLENLSASEENNSDNQTDNNDDAVSDDGSTQNSSNLIVQDFSGDIHHEEGEVVELDHFKRIQKHNQKILQNEYETFQEGFHKSKSQAQLPAIPKQQFIYRPNEKRSIHEVFSQSLESKTEQETSSFMFVPVKIALPYTIFQFFKGSQQTSSSVISLFKTSAFYQSAQSYSVDHMGRMRLSSSGGGYNHKTPHLQVKAEAKIDKGRIARLKNSLSNNTSKATGQGRLLQGPGSVSQSSQSGQQARILKGPGYVAPLPIAGQVAGCYITLFMVAPRVGKNTVTIFSPNTKVKEKASAAIDLGVMAVTMWGFTKYVAGKYPKTAAALMVYTAGKHLVDQIDPLLKKLSKGQTGQKLYYLDKETYLRSTPSCTDGRKIYFLDHLKKYNKLSLPNQKR